MEGIGPASEGARLRLMLALVPIGPACRLLAVVLSRCCCCHSHKNSASLLPTTVLVSWTVANVTATPHLLLSGSLLRFYFRDPPFHLIYPTVWNLPIPPLVGSGGYLRSRNTFQHQTEPDPFTRQIYPESQLEISSGHFIIVFVWMVHSLPGL